MIELDELDHKAAEAFPGHIVRKDLVRRFRGQFPVPTYVVEFMLGRYCASTDPEEIEEGLEMVQAQLSDRTVRAGEEELFKSKARDRGSVRIIDIITARLDAKTDSYLATLPSLRLNDVRIPDKVVLGHERMLTGGFYAEVEVGYDASIAQEMGGRPFEILNLREIQLSTRDILDKVAVGRSTLSTREWRDLLLRSVGLEPAALSARAQDATLLRMVPFVERNYNFVELGPRGTGKSHLFQQVSPYAHLVSGGKATVARMFVNMANGQRGLVCQYDVVCFDEVSGISFDQKDGVNIMKGYMESGEFSRGRESIRAEGSIVMIGNFDVDVQHQQRVGRVALGIGHALSRQRFVQLGEVFSVAPRDEQPPSRCPHLVLYLALLPSCRRRARYRLKQVVTRQLLIPAIEVTLLTPKNRRYRRLHVVDQGSLGDTADKLKPPTVGIKQHLLALSQVRDH